MDRLSHHSRLLFAFVVLILVAGAGTTQAQLGDVPGDTAAKKKRPKKCKKNQVRVKILKRTTCRSARKALPRPRAGDRRYLYVKAALKATTRGTQAAQGPVDQENAAQGEPARCSRDAEGGQTRPRDARRVGGRAARRGQSSSGRSARRGV